jgi:hypothetical protein
VSKLATFRVEEDVWEAFLAATKEEGVSASSALLEFVRWYVAGNRLAKPETITDDNIEQIVDARIASLESQLEARMVALLDSRLGEQAA